MRFAKGHGTGNDFVIIPDPEGELSLPPALVARICDRHFGLGADGILRVVRTGAVPASELGDARAPAVPSPAERSGLSVRAGGAEWFMDYRNADGSVAEMCGNGVRVFVRFLLGEGLVTGPLVDVATRAGVRRVRVEDDGRLGVDMGPARVLGEGEVQLGAQRLTGLAISVGNPHLACVVDGPVADVQLDAPGLVSFAGRLDPPANGLPGGVNVEVVRFVGDHEVEMRVHERGSGLTLSCGTGAVAAAAAAAVNAGDWRAGREASWTVRVPGGTLTVTPSATASVLIGPAEILASGELAASWLSDQSLAVAPTAGIRLQASRARPGNAGSRRAGELEAGADERPPGPLPDGLTGLPGDGRAAAGGEFVADLTLPLAG
jgi:diaminopimelate epimerase